MKKRVKNYIIIFVLTCLILFIIGTILLLTDDNMDINKKHMIFADISEIQNIDGMKTVSLQNDETIENLNVVEALYLEYMIDNAEIDIRVYLFEESTSSTTYFYEATRQQRDETEGYTIKKVLMHSKYCIYKNNCLIYASTKGRYKKMNKFIELLDNNLTVFVSF